ncbi:bifunctional phosphoribosylaminoimidazolecarboxamide formyltransferase/IMP cyclohydrolase [Mesorhizobium sp. M0488]|uniref:bifunctional phosphoribosylaminoimidazolecarboxamide formyltransferase/IMP cyclohydrolase n=1 Tax=unclassified Mesorhizobium TaxID=325217 RepID=UPI00333C76E6
MSNPRPRRAIISVWNKDGVVEIARVLRDLGVELFSTGGTAATLAAAGMRVADIGELTGVAPLLDGRVKALHPAVFAGLLARPDRPQHDDELRSNRFARFDFLVAGVRPFEATAEDEAGALDLIDIGGPAMVRAAAKNPDGVVVMTAVEDYAPVIAALANEGAVSASLRRSLASRAFARMAAHDAAIAAWYARDADPFAAEALHLTAASRKILRYGENPHQRAALYLTGARSCGAATATLLQGKELSYVNLLDADAAFALACRFTEPAAVIVKHAAPCGVAVAGTGLEAYQRAHAADPLSAFGGTVGLNVPLDAATAERLSQVFTEVVIAPDATPAARQLLAAKPNLRLLVNGTVGAPGCTEFRSIGGGILMQDVDQLALTIDDLRVVTSRQPSPLELNDMLFGFQVVRFVKSNAVVLVSDRQTLGIGGGQSSRIGAVKLALAEHGESAPRPLQLVLASDAFFPFPDSVEAAAAAGVAAIIQQGSAARDRDVIAAADAAGIAMAFTGVRAFRH